MPYTLPKPCTAPGCPRMQAREGRCEVHKRGSAASQGYGADWRKLRAQHLAAHPLCHVCGRLGVDVDHIVPHRGNDNLRLDFQNLQTLCRACHSRKTASQDMG